MEPRFCPNPKCVHHLQDRSNDPDETFWVRIGFYYTKVVGPVQRFRCNTCGKNFSARTFSIDYYTKKSLDNKEIFRSIGTSESVSSIARHLDCSLASVQNRLERLGRASIALHVSLTSSLRLSEHLVADGFESFDRSQYFPNNINILVGKKSQFLYCTTHTTIRRKGRMTAEQKIKRVHLERIYRAPASGIRESFTRLLAEVPQLWDNERMPELHLLTDLHLAYPHAIERVKPLAEAQERGSFVHKRYSSEIPRTVVNPLFSVNYWDRELRKDLAAFRRESTCFTRNVGNGMLRMANHIVWHNYVKDYRIGDSDYEDFSHANYVGIEQNVVDRALAKLFIDRVFLSRIPISQIWVDIWLKRNKTPLKKWAEYIPKYVRAGCTQCSDN